jgi:hypothetical protein
LANHLLVSRPAMKRPARLARPLAAKINPRGKGPSPNARL